MSASAMLTVGFLTLVAAAVLWHAAGLGLPKRYRRRSCQGRAWRAAFPESPKREIREFLGLFANCFGFRERDRLRFAPNDRVFEIYRAVNRITDWDALELETYAAALLERYGIKLATIWNEDLTLGQVFAHVHGGSSDA